MLNINNISLQDKQHSSKLPAPQDAALKSSLRACLAKLCPEEDLQCWYDPLYIKLDKNGTALTVIFPHHLFAPWFDAIGKKQLEYCCINCLGNELSIHYKAQLPDREYTAQVSEILNFIPEKTRVQTADTENKQNGQPANETSQTRQTKKSRQPFGAAFTLDRFIVNKKNFFPLEVAKELLRDQNIKNYNPLVYCGKGGSGKTHVLRALANGLAQLYTDQVFCGDAASFIDACENKNTNLQDYKAYCIDDIHSLSNSHLAQQKMVALLDACLDDKRQVICTCTGLISSHRAFSENLRSRLEHGLLVELKLPDMDVRLRFARAQCSEHQVDIANDHILLLAQRCTSLRYLSGIILKIAAYQRLVQRRLDNRDIENILSFSGDNTSVTAQHIIAKVAEHYALSPEELLGNSRKTTHVLARQSAMYLCRDLLASSYPALGRIFGGKDHSTVIHSIKKIEQMLVMNKDAHKEITEIKQSCLSTDSQ